MFAYIIFKRFDTKINFYLIDTYYKFGIIKKYYKCELIYTLKYINYRYNIV